MSNLTAMARLVSVEVFALLHVRLLCVMTFANYCICNMFGVMCLQSVTDTANSVACYQMYTRYMECMKRAYKDPDWISCGLACS